MPTTEQRARAVLRKERLAGIVKQLKKRGEWDAKNGPRGGLAELGRLVVEINESRVDSSNIKKWLEDMGEDVSWVRGPGLSNQETIDAEPAKIRLKELIDSGDYPKNLGELGRIVADEGQPPIGTSTISRWLKKGDYPKNLVDDSWTSISIPSKHWLDSDWTSWQESRELELEGDSAFAIKFRDTPDHLKERYRDAVKNRDALKIDGKKSEYTKVRNAIDAHAARLSESVGGPSGSGSFKKPEEIPDFDTWDELLRSARKRADNAFSKFISRGRGRSLNLLRDPRESNYVFNLFLRAQIDHLANKQPLKQMSHGYAAKGEKSSGLNNAFQVFLENWHPNLVRGSLNVEEKLKSGKPDLAWLRWKDAEKKYNIYNLRRDVPIVDARQVLGDLPLSGKYANKRIPWMELDQERLSNLTSLTFGKILEDIRELHPERFSQEPLSGEIIQQISRGTADDYMRAHKSGSRTPYSGNLPVSPARSGVPSLGLNKGVLDWIIDRKVGKKLKLM